MQAVVAGGPGLVAVGCDFTGVSGSDEGGIAAVWASADGLAWRRVSQDAVSGGVAGHCMNSVAVAGPGLVAVGYDHFVGYFHGTGGRGVGEPTGRLMRPRPSRSPLGTFPRTLAQATVGWFGSLWRPDGGWGIVSPEGQPCPSRGWVRVLVSTRRSSTSPMVRSRLMASRSGR